MSQQHLETAAVDVRKLAAEQNGRISAEDAHNAWRWVLVTYGWTQGDDGTENKQHPLLTSFSQLPDDRREHALQYLVEEKSATGNPRGKNAKQNDSHVLERPVIQAGK